MNIEKIDAQNPNAEPESLPAVSAGNLPEAIFPVLKTLGGDEQGHVTMEEMTAIVAKYMLDSGDDEPGDDEKVAGRRKLYVQESDTATVYYHSGVDDDDWLPVSSANARQVITTGILSTDDYPSVRSAVGFWVDDKIIPDGVLDQSIYVPASEMEIKDLVPGAETKTGNSLFYIKNAIIYRTAYKLVLSYPQLIQQAIMSDQLRWQPIDVETKLDFLLREENRNLGKCGVLRNSVSVFSLGGSYKEALEREYAVNGYYFRFPSRYRYDEYRKRLVEDD